MSETPVRKAPVTNDPASAPPHPQQRQGEHDLRQDPRQDTPQDPRDPRDPRQEQRQEQREDIRQEQQPVPSQHQQQEKPAAAQHQQQERTAGRLEDEWQAVQYEFVDDPKAAVRKADELVTRAIGELTARHRSLTKQLEGNGDPQTEDLRLALHRYRELFKSLVAVK
ncbi:hypothetical protein C8D87_107400 [Lentzea atacamensis]|uniref:Uncharacterized protein n=1 Tax=Lentzea atacamensis TaxID=531938 RepID=A0ABX9E3D1_9PSEU|nr:hypothetical protein [Lentzea atacamensis]RAS63251.1 hypothetical protein C8D87_107400 [Lentzea atacamensis]